jgi:hypothetical protein
MMCICVICRRARARAHRLARRQGGDSGADGRAHERREAGGAVCARSRRPLQAGLSPQVI